MLNNKEPWRHLQLWVAHPISFLYHLSTCFLLWLCCPPYPIVTWVCRKEVMMVSSLSSILHSTLEQSKNWLAFSKDSLGMLGGKKCILYLCPFKHFSFYSASMSGGLSSPKLIQNLISQVILRMFGGVPLRDAIKQFLQNETLPPEGTERLLQCRMVNKMSLEMWKVLQTFFPAS